MLKSLIALAVLCTFIQPVLASTLSDAEWALATGDYAKAIEAYQEYLKENPDSYAGSFGLARALAFSGERTDAILLLNIILEKIPGDPDALLMRGRIYGWNKNYAAAETDILKVTESTPEYSDAWAALGDLYMWSDRPERAVDAYTKYVVLKPDDPQAYISRAKAYVGTRRFTTARTDLNKAQQYGGDETEIDKILRIILRNPAATAWEVSVLFDDNSKAWNSYETAARREFSSGSIMISANGQKRDVWDSALLTDCYWDLWRRAYGNLRIQTSKAAFLPRMDYLIEIYQGIGTGWEISGGYRRMQYQPAVDIYILSLGLYTESWYFRERIHLSPASGEINQTYLSTARFYFRTIDDYIELTLGLLNEHHREISFLQPLPITKIIAELKAQTFFGQRIGGMITGGYKRGYKQNRLEDIELNLTFKLMYRL